MDGSDEDAASENSSEHSLIDEDDDDDKEESDPFSTDEDFDYEFPESAESDEDDDDDYYALRSEKSRSKRQAQEKENKAKENEKEKEREKEKTNVMFVARNYDIEEGEIITQFMTEQGELPELYTKLTTDDVLEEIEENDGPSSYKMELDSEMPTTSFAGIGKRFKSDENAEEDDEDDWGIQRKSGKDKTRSRRSLLNPTLQGLMGEANLCYARGKVEMAEKICLEIIRQNPLAAEPFFTLASIYETRDSDKYLNFLTIACHLSPSDRDQWIRVAEMHIAKKNLTQARIYYTKAIKNIPKDYDLRWRKGQLLEKLGEEHLAYFTYLKMIPLMPYETYELCLATAKKLAHYYHKHEKFKNALQAMEGAYGVCGAHFSVFDMNLYIDLLIINKQYKKALDILKVRTNFLFEMDEKDKDKIVLCLIPKDLIPELRSKICVSLIKLKSFLLSDYIICNMLEQVPIVYDRLDLFIDVAEAFMEEDHIEEALRILKSLIVKLEEECPAFIWLKHADCLNRLGDYDTAIRSYGKVLKLAPHCHEARLTLATLLVRQSRLSEAIDALDQEIVKGEPIHGRVLFEKCDLLRKTGRFEEFFENAYTLLSRYSIVFKSREELFALSNSGNFYNPDGLKVILTMRNMTEQVDKALQEFNRMPNEKTDLTIEEEFNLFNRLIEMAFNCKKYGYIQKLCFAMITTKRFINYHKQLEPVVILACYFNNDCTIGFSYLRELIVKNPQCNQYWNLLSLFIQKGWHLRYHCFVRRLVKRLPNIRQMRIFLGHYHFHCCSFKYALNIYVPLFKEYQQPILALCIAVVFNQITLQKKVLRKSAALAQSITFAQKYAELRGSKDQTVSSPVQQEIFYNIGRIYHQAGLTHLALDYYERALAIDDPFVKEHEKYLGLKEEVAFNIHLIYRAGGNYRKAQQYLYEYIIV